MQGRTRLTTPPGQAPEPVAWSTDAADELYSPGFELPLEPVYPAKGQRAALMLATVLLLVALGVLAFRAVTASQAFDPSLGPPSPPATSGG